MPATITLRDLEALNACPSQRELFASTFPEGVTITPDNAAAVALAAVEAGLDVGWYADRALFGDEWEAYLTTAAPAQAAYLAAVAPALAAYKAVETPALTACETAGGAAWSAYRAIEAPAWAAYKDVETPARAARKAAITEALCYILARRGEPC